MPSNGVAGVDIAEELLTFLDRDVIRRALQSFRGFSGANGAADRFFDKFESLERVLSDGTDEDDAGFANPSELVDAVGS